ncbi:MAG TPA: cupin domain-containing protein [Chitinophagaceae bacterium]|nr:cupin domain-containing protein [Chitinophagaceae bacterium]
MAFINKIIKNPVTQQEIKFLQTARDTNGQLLEMEARYLAHSKEPAAHYHPFQEEEFTVLSGQLSIRFNEEVIILKPGDTLQVPKNKVHSMWNDSDGETVMNWKVRPALQTEYFLETVVGLAADGKTNKAGMPGLLQVALMANQFSREFRLIKPPLLIQKIIFAILSPIASLAGFKPTYKKYID